MALEQSGVQLIAMGGDVYITTLANATKATHGFVDATEQGGGKVSAAGQVMIGALRQIGTIAVDAFAAAGKATLSFVKDSIGVAGDFEAGMLNFQSVAGKDIDTQGLEKFRALFIDIGKRLPVSTTEVQNAATELVKGGIEPATLAAGGLESSIKFASAALDGDLTKAAEISAKVVGGWASVTATAAEKADLMTHAQDQMTKAANASTVDVDELARGVYNAQGVFKTAGGTFDDLTVTIAALSPRFASASEAGNSFKNFMARLQPTTKDATATMIDLGLMTEEGGNKFYDAQGKFIGVQKASQLLQDSLKGLNEQQRQSALQTIFGNDAMGSAAGLANLGAAGYQNMADSMAKANGVAEAAAIKQQGFNVALDNAKGSVEALQITIGSYLLPVLADLLNNVVAPAVNTFTDMASAVFGSDEAFSRLSPTAQGIVQVIDLLIADTQEIIGAFNDAGAESSDFASTIGYLADDLGLPGDLIADIVFAVQDLIGAFGAVEKPAASVADVMAYAEKKGISLQDAMAELSKGTSTLGGALEDLNGVWTLAGKVVADVMAGYEAVVKAVLPQIQQFVANHGEEIQSFFKSTWNSIIQIVTLALQLYDSIVPPILNAIAKFINAHGEEIQKVLSGAWTMITSIITGTLDTIKGVINVALDLIHGDWSKAWTDIQGIANTQVTAIEGVVKGFLDMIAGIFNTSMDGLVQTWTDNWNMLVDIATQTDWGQVGEDVVSGIISGVESAAGSLMRTLKNLASDALQAAKDALGISSPSTEFMPIGEFSVLGIMQGFSDTWPQLTSLVSDLGDELVKQAADIAASVQDAIGDAFGATASIDRQKAKNLEDVNKLDPKRRTGVQQQIDAAEQIALAMNDPQQAQAYFAMRSKQLLELGQLNDQINATTDAKERERLMARYDLINAAQQAEMKQFDVKQQADGTQTDDIAAKLQALLNSAKMPGALNDPIVAQIVHLLDQLTSPPASSAQYASSGQTSYNQQSTVNMPIYTNNTPAAIQQSWAVMQASMP
jgi:TP901 family phage tail tape measure protein